MGELTVTVAGKMIDLFWVTFNTVNMYGTKHPLAMKTIAQLYEAVQRALGETSELIIHLDGQRVFCNGHPANPNLNLGRLVERMNNAGILSINFLSGLRHEELGEFFRILIDRKDYPRLEAMNEAIKEHKIEAIRLNAFAYVKVAAGQMVKEVIDQTEQPVSVITGTISDADSKSKNTLLGGVDHSSVGESFSKEKRGEERAEQKAVKAAANVEKKVSQKVVLAGIENASRTRRRLEEEVYRARRYLQPLSALLISVEQEPGALLSPGDIAVAFKSILPVLLSRLRFIDFVGLAGPVKENLLLVILPQTEQTGVQAVIRRVQSALGKNFVISYTIYDPQKCPDARSFLREIIREHLKRLQNAEKLE